MKWRLNELIFHSKFVIRNSKFNCEYSQKDRWNNKTQRKNLYSKINFGISIWMNIKFKSQKPNMPKFLWIHFGFERDIKKFKLKYPFIHYVIKIIIPGRVQGSYQLYKELLTWSKAIPIDFESPKNNVLPGWKPPSWLEFIFIENFA